MGLLSFIEAPIKDIIHGLEEPVEEITRIFGTIPDFITDHWVTEMLENRSVSQGDLVKYVAAETGSPFTLKETYEFLDEEWENTEEVLNSREAFNSFLESW